MKKIFVVIVFILVLFGGGYVLTRSSNSSSLKDKSYDPGYVSGKESIPSKDVDKSISVSPAAPSSADDMLLLAIAHFIPQVQWGSAASDTVTILGKTYPGDSMQGTYQSSVAGVSDFGEKQHLLDDGWSVASNLAAGGPNGNEWGYTADKEGGKELLYFSYTNSSFTPPPGKTTCPCTFQVKVFHSNSF